MRAMGMGRRRRREERRREGEGWKASTSAKTPWKQKHPFSRENKPPSQDLREWATSAGRGSSTEGRMFPSGRTQDGLGANGLNT